MNVIARLEYELVYYVSAVHRFNHYTRTTPPPLTFVYHHHDHVVPLARISLTLSRHFSLSFIVSGWSSGLHISYPHIAAVCMFELVFPAFAWPYAGFHRSTSLMSSSLLLQQCPACLVRLTWIVFVMGGRWQYSWCLVGYAARIFSILLTKFLCNCRPTSSPDV